MLKELLKARNIKRRKRPTKNKLQTNENGNRITHSNNYLKCKWIKCINQKTQTNWVDEKFALMSFDLPHHSI